jgi:hypothetical protein
VIAETAIHFIKSSDDRAAYMLPELPTQKLQRLVRGYGLADSNLSWRNQHGNNAPALNLTAVIAKDAVEAAKVYQEYWMLATESVGISIGRQRSKASGWMHNFKSSCNFTSWVFAHSYWITLQSETELKTPWKHGIVCNRRSRRMTAATAGIVNSR